ncbi:MAG: ribosomal protein S18-alanine N-acetyltransferase [Bradymonadaceae bacterium]|nr:ribosomal protein S18-alanine N-acetyltransferase [Lujinxingiaceae bacterium]
MASLELASQPAPWPLESFEREQGLAWSRTWLVEDPSTGQLLAFLVFWIVHDEVHILNVAVDPAARRRGIARAVLRHFVAICRQKRVSFVTLEVRAGNEAARGLYAALGFRRIGRRKNYYADNGEDGVVMGLNIEES